MLEASAKSEGDKFTPKADLMDSAGMDWLRTELKMPELALFSWRVAWYRDLGLSDML